MILYPAKGLWKLAGLTNSNFMFQLFSYRIWHKQIDSSLPSLMNAKERKRK